MCVKTESLSKLYEVEGDLKDKTMTKILPLFSGTDNANIIQLWCLLNKFIIPHKYNFMAFY